MIPLTFALLASIGWGTANFIGGLKSRSSPVLPIVLLSQGVGLLVLALAVISGGIGSPTARSAGFGALAGLGALVGAASLYKGLAMGAMSIVAPIAATGAALPVCVGVLTGDHLNRLQAGGIALALVSVACAAREARSERGGTFSIASGVGLALLAALGLGGFLTAIDAASTDGVFWAMLFQRIALVGLLLALVLSLRVSIEIGRLGMKDLIALGLLAVLSDILYAWASTEGPLSIVAVLGALYPLTTIVLARIVIGERVGRGQWLGIGGAIIGVVCIAIGRSEGSA